MSAAATRVRASSLRILRGVSPPANGCLSSLALVASPRTALSPRSPRVLYDARVGGAEGRLGEVVAAFRAIEERTGVDTFTVREV